MARALDTRERILKAAIELIWEQGYAAVTVDSVCARASINKGSFYHFFPSKSRLAVEALEHHWERTAPDYDRMFSPCVPPLERLSRYFAFVYEKQRGHKERCGRVLGCPFVSVGSEVIKQDRAISEAAQAMLRRKAKYLESALRDAQAEGLLRVEDPAAQAQAVLAYVEGALTQARIRNDLGVLRGLEAGARRLLAVEAEALA